MATALALEALIETALHNPDGTWRPEAERLLVEAQMAEGVPSMAAVMAISAEVRRVMQDQDEANPRRDDNDLSRDLIYRLGVRHGINMFRGISPAARNIIAEQRKRASA